MIDRSPGLVPEEHLRLLPPPDQRKGDSGSQLKDERECQRLQWRGRSSAAQADHTQRCPAVDLSDRGGSSTRLAASQTDAATLGHLPWTPAAWQVGSANYNSHNALLPVCQSYGWLRGYTWTGSWITPEVHCQLILLAIKIP